MIVQKNRNEYTVKKSLRLTDKEVLASFKNAKRIQEAIFKPVGTNQNDLKNSFIYNRPKDIVGGDFYWSYQICDQLLLTVGDCSGHGIGGALLSILGYTGLKKIVMDSRTVDPSQILNKLNEYFHSILQINHVNHVGTIDISFCKINTSNDTLEFAGARNPIYLIRQNEIIEMNGDKHSIGDYSDTIQPKYGLQKMKLKKDDIIYLFSDGYADQIGGPDDRKIMSRNFKQLLIAMGNKSLEQQKALLHNFIEGWKNENSQTDDICVMGYQYCK